MTNLFIDCEFNDFGGELISMALVPRYGDHFYEVLPCTNPTKWVRENVIPVLGKEPLHSRAEFSERLESFLDIVGAADGVHVIATWPEDLKHLMDVMITGPGKCIQYPKITMELMDMPNLESEKPHNALWDAVAMRHRYYLP